ncbi:hypothetical protein [Litoreibacter albidus]|uniref:hypothetical protein n=1 Tax=Litoreibacter albidus TaxID=670155 RepID=UPI003736A5EF
MNSIDVLEPLLRRRSRVDNLTAKVRALRGRYEELQRSIADYRAFEPEIEKAKIANLEIITTDRSRQIADQEVNKENLKRKLRVINSDKVSPLMVWKYFTAEQDQIRSEAKRLTEQLASTNQCLQEDQETLFKVRAQINSISKRISDHENFDLNTSEKWLSSLGPEIEHLKAELAADKVELMHIEAKIRPHTSELDRLKSELATLNADIASADRFEQGLASASNGYESAMIHEECEKKFETGSPKQVIKDRERKIRSLENNVPKLERRIRDELQKVERTIGHLLIDGNNVCYEGQSFIGLRAVSALIKELGGRFKISVVFDASIRAMLKTDTQGVERALGDTVNTYVVPTKMAADEYLLKLADQDSGAYILSNDRFAEYHDYSVVKSDRVCRFLIAEGKLMVNDFDISVNV